MAKSPVILLIGTSPLWVSIRLGQYLLQCGKKQLSVDWQYVDALLKYQQWSASARDVELTLAFNHCLQKKSIQNLKCIFLVTLDFRCCSQGCRSGGHEGGNASLAFHWEGQRGEICLLKKIVILNAVIFYLKRKEGFEYWSIGIR